MLAAIPPGNELQDRGISEWMGNLLRFHLSAPSLMCPSHRVVTRVCVHLLPLRASPHSGDSRRWWRSGRPEDGCHRARPLVAGQGVMLRTARTRMRAQTPWDSR